MHLLLVLGVLLVMAGIFLGFTALQPQSAGLPRERRRPFEEESTSQLSRFAGVVVHALERHLKRHPTRIYRRELLELAGMKLNQADYIILVIAGTLAASAIGSLLGGIGLGLLLGCLSPFLGHLVLVFRINQRRARFDSQLGDLLQLLTGGLRAGHSILRSIDAAGVEADAPTSEEMRRIITETSLGKDLMESLEDTAKRMDSDDFTWIGQAIQINREVGGDLAEVLEQVNGTIRERSEIKGQIKALSAEGKFSAYILMAMPFVITLLLSVINPGYIGVLFTEPLGWAMIAASVVLMAIGGLWMRKIIDLKF